MTVGATKKMNKMTWEETARWLKDRQMIAEAIEAYGSDIDSLKKLFEDFEEMEVQQHGRENVR